jgi:protein-disulfide isomerase
MTVPTRPLYAKGVVIGLAVAGGIAALAAVRSADPQRPAPAALPSARAVATASASGNVARGADARASEVWKIPVHPDDPVKGATDALVTVVALSEFESPFCKRAARVLDELLAAYPRDVRVVWKDYPLPFNARARPAAIFARQVEREKGPKAFWAAHDALFASQPKLSDDDLRGLAGTLGITWEGANAAIDSGGGSEAIDRGIELGADAEARGTPHFFINGRRLAGSQPLDRFKALVDDLLVEANAFVAQGMRREDVYEAIIKAGKEAPPLVEKEVPPPDASSPFRGAVDATVVIQQFAEFPCAACARSAPVLEDLEKEYGGKLKLVWRLLLPPSDPSALLTAQVALETFAQRGAPAFWTFHERLLEARAQQGTLDEATLFRIATETSVDRVKLEQALASGRHKARALDDSARAQQAGLQGSPSFVIGSFVLPGDARWPLFKKAISRTLRKRRSP